MDSDANPQLSRRETDSGEPKVTVLAIDDDRAYLLYLQRLLSRAGYEVRLATDGGSAIEILRNEKIDLLLVDLNMPGMDGIETVRRIQADAALRNLYAILLTAANHADTRVHALDSGLDDFMDKASTGRELLAKLRSAVRRLEVERQLHIENAQLQALALTDELTGLANRRSLFQTAQQMLESALPLAVVLFDLNEFKQINDTFGHLAGDRVLADLGRFFNDRTRLGDLAGRYGGDEFVLLCPASTETAARKIAERLAAEMRELSWTIRGETFGISCTFGVSWTDIAGRDQLPEILSRCDEELYREKQRPPDGQ